MPAGFQVLIAQQLSAMKILYLHQHFTTPQGSSGTRSYEVARRLVARGHQVTMVCGSSTLADSGATSEPVRGIRRGVVDGIDVVQICVPYSNHDGLLKRSTAFLRYALKAVSIAWAEPYDVMFATSTPLTAAIPGIAMRILRPSRKFVFEVRDLWPELPKAMGVIRNPMVLAAMSVLEKLAYSAMHGGVALSPGIQAGMRKRSRSGKPIAMVPNGCDLKEFAPPNSAPEDLGLPTNFPLDGLRCVFAGAHGLANGLEAVLDTAKVLKERGRTDIHLVFIGDGKLKPLLLERQRREALSNCHFFAPMPKYQLAKVLQRVDVGLMILANVPAFYYGTSPNKFFDYIASGLPVLNNYPGWLADIISSRGCGAAVPPDDPQAFADALTRMADDADALERMGRNARRLAEQEFDRDQLTHQLIGLIEEIHQPRDQSDAPVEVVSGTERLRRAA